MSPTKKVVAVGHSILEKDDDTLPKYLQGIGKLRKEFNFGKYNQWSCISHFTSFFTTACSTCIIIHVHSMQFLMPQSMQS